MRKYRAFLILGNSTPSFKTDFRKSDDVSNKMQAKNSIPRAIIAP